MPPKNSGGSTKFPGGHKVIHRTAQTAVVRVVTPRKKGKGPKAKKESTCTLKVVCLSSKNAQSPPSSVRERPYLSNIGLGDSSITFPAQEHVYSKILESFPALSKAGGFEICLFQRGGGEDAGFHVINPPLIGTRLKQLAGQAKIYIRPIQRDIDLSGVN